MTESSQTKIQKDRIISGLSRTNHAHDVVLVADFTSWYCKKHHKSRPKVARQFMVYEILGTPAKNYAVMCDECAEFVRYSEKRTALCKQEPKPFCAHCSLKCYAPAMQEYSRKVMRYSGPRALFSRHAFAALKHLLEQNKR